MKNRLLSLVFFVFAFQITIAQEWMTDLSIAQKLALVQNKMVLMVWEGTTEYSYPVFVNDENGRRIFIQNLYEDEVVSPLIWQHFVPVIVSENNYGLMYAEIKGKRSQAYIDKFNDNSIKIMDVNGNIINTKDVYYEELQNITEIIKKYGLNTEYLSIELNNYKTQKDFYAAYYLASKYMDFSLYAKKLKSNLLELSEIYISEAKELAASEANEDKAILLQRCQLLEAQEYLFTKRPNKVLRVLKRMDAETIDNSNSAFIAYLYYTAYASLGKLEKAEVWKSKISSVNLKKAQLLINLNT